MSRDQQLKLKRAIDIIGASLGLVATAPAIAITAAAVRFSMGRPVFFRQSRPGLNGVPFAIYKFRTMNNARAESGELLPDAERLTRVGRFIRAASLDELPQLMNVLRGDMSLVGPRPLLMQYLSRYSPRQARRHEVRPGITGLAQVRGRNALTWAEKFELDVEYVERWSLLLDVQILLETVVSVATRRGISNRQHATMPEFTGEQAGS